MIDCNFPVLKYARDQSSLEWGRQHGEKHRDGIAELVQIRTDLMREKNSTLTKQRIEDLASQQWTQTRAFDVELTDELIGIADGSGASVTDLVILNNYTDFRDIQLDDQGCSLVYSNSSHGPVIGQTWDMHGSAKRYVCCIQVPDCDSDHESVIFSLVGCVGMMGFTSRRTVMGVNNINTDGAQPGVLWPVVVRNVLKGSTLKQMTDRLTTAPVTSGHNYLLAEQDEAQMWEVAPGLAEMVDAKGKGEQGYMFHTNHCLGAKMVERETTISQNSTTHIRYDLLEKKVASAQSFDEMYALMNDHENYPKSICSNFQANTQDPSVTCGGAVGNLKTGKVKMWRGDPLYDENFVVHEFDLSVD